MRFMKYIIAISLATVMLTGCHTNVKHRDVGLVTGGVAGGVLGNELFNSTTGTIVGAVGGALGGREIGKHFEEE